MIFAKIRTKAIKTYFGDKEQRLKLIEEMNELIEAIEKGDEDNFIEELADVSLLIDQFNCEEFHRIKRKKINRTIARIFSNHYSMDNHDARMERTISYMKDELGEVEGQDYLMSFK